MRHGYCNGCNNLVTNCTCEVAPLLGSVEEDAQFELDEIASVPLKLARKTVAQDDLIDYDGPCAYCHDKPRPRGSNPCEGCGA